MAKKKSKKKKIAKVKKPLVRKIKPKKVEKKEAEIKTADSSDLVHKTRIRIIGIGGGACSIISEIAPQAEKVDFIGANTDAQALKEMNRKIRPFNFGQNLTQGLGCGMDARLGQKAALEDKNKIAKLFHNIDLAILVASLGGGAGTGAAPEFARIAREMGVMTFGIFTMPFKFEGAKRTQIAKLGLDKITPNLNAISIIPNENIFQIIDKTTPLKQAFSAINKRLADNLKGLIEMIYLPGLINIDFADLKTILEGKGRLSYLNSASSQGVNRVEAVVKEVLKSPLNEYNIQGAERIVFNITASKDLAIQEVENISRSIANFNKRAKIIFGVSQDNNYKDRLRIVLLAVGCGKTQAMPEIAKPKSKPKTKSKPVIKSKLTKKPVAKPKKKSKPRPIKKVKVEVKPQEPEEKPLTRRNALDLRKVVEKTEQEIAEQEKKWDIPAFLRRKTEEHN
jgi:cell division protein FtsZ